jgi:peptide/nickel transport system substrate-binding protein
MTNSASLSGAAQICFSKGSIDMTRSEFSSGQIMPAMRARRRRFVVPVLVCAALLLAACSSSPNSSSGGKAVKGGTVSIGVVGVPPNYVFPFLTPAVDSGSNVVYFMATRYLSLYYAGSTIVPSESEALPPTYSNGDKTVTVRLKKETWSDGKPVTSRDVLFAYNLLKANKTSSANYVPGEFPDNVKSVSTPNSSTVVFQLNAAYNPTWFTDDELSSLTAFPQHAWDKESANGKIGNYDETTAGAQAVYKFLSGQASDSATYSTNPLWKVVDGAWVLQSYQPNGPDVLTPNPYYSPKPHVSELVIKTYTTDTAEFNALLAGGQLNIGSIPTQDLQEQSRATAAGYYYTPSWIYQISFMNMNFENPVTGPLVRQLYIRQALQHLMDETGQVSAFLDNGKAGRAVYGPIPAESPYASSVQATDPYPFSVSAARSLLTQHGWTIPKTGAAFCAKPGSAASDCGAGIKAGQKLQFSFLYDTGPTFLQQEVANYQSDASKAGIVLKLSSAPFGTTFGDLLGCVGTSKCPASSWQLGTWSTGYSWGFSSAYATGDFVFFNTNYSNPTFTRLVHATETSPNTLTAMHAYDTFTAEQLPVIWTVTTNFANETSKNLHGVKYPTAGYLNTTDWYFVK